MLKKWCTPNVTGSRILVGELLSQIDSLEEAIARLDSEIATMLHPFEAELAQLDSIPGVSQRIAEALLAEIGVEMTPYSRAALPASNA